MRLVTKIVFVLMIPDDWMISLGPLFDGLNRPLPDSKFSFGLSLLHIMCLWLLWKILDFKAHIRRPVSPIVTKSGVLRFDNISPLTRYTCFRKWFIYRRGPCRCIFGLAVKVIDGQWIESGFGDRVYRLFWLVIWLRINADVMRGVWHLLLWFRCFQRCVSLHWVILRRISVSIHIHTCIDVY